MVEGDHFPGKVTYRSRTPYELASWADLRSALETLRREASIGRSATDLPELIFRGLPSAHYDLESTLERWVRTCPDPSRCTQALNIKDYMRQVFIARAAIQSFTRREWPLDSVRWFGTATPPTRTATSVHALFSNDELRFLTYMRHHGFPSPLLDWTASPYVAAYFAFAGANVESTDRVAVHAYREMGLDGRLTAPRGSLTDTIGSSLATDPRHHRQQAIYTVCLSNDMKRFVGFDEAIGPLEAPSLPRSVIEGRGFDQDERWLFTVPASERATALRDLDLMNINAFSLFDDEDSLMRMLANRAYAM